MQKVIRRIADDGHFSLLSQPRPSNFAIAPSPPRRSDAARSASLSSPPSSTPLDATFSSVDRLEESRKSLKCQARTAFDQGSTSCANDLPAVEIAATSNKPVKIRHVPKPRRDRWRNDALTDGEDVRRPVHRSRLPDDSATRTQRHAPCHGLSVRSGHPLRGKLHHFVRVLEAQLFLNVRAVGFDGLDAQVQHLRDAAGGFAATE